MKTRTLAKHAPEQLLQLTPLTLKLLKSQPSNHYLLRAAAEALSTINASMSSNLSEAQLEVHTPLHVNRSGMFLHVFTHWWPNKC